MLLLDLQLRSSVVAEVGYVVKIIQFLRINSTKGLDFKIYPSLQFDSI